MTLVLAYSLENNYIKKNQHERLFSLQENHELETNF